MMLLQTIWFIIIAVLFTGYSILDGFDLGVGTWYLLTREEKHRRALLKAIAPFWDGNEVWLLTGGGALFAAFPHVYATVFSGFYLALLLVVLALIFRAVAIEFRNQEDHELWRWAWDLAFGLGSFLPALLLGVAFGNILRGLPLDSDMNFTGTFFTLLNPPALMVGLVGLTFFATHGALYIQLRTEGELAKTAARRAQSSWAAFLLFTVVTMIVFAVRKPQLLVNATAMPVLWLLPLLALGAIVAVGVLNGRDEVRRAFIASSLSIALLLITSAAALFPNIVPALGGPSLNLTVATASSSQLTLMVMLVLALIGMPIVLMYTIWVYRTFGGKVTAGEGEAY